VAESAEPYAAFDWKLHQTLTVASGNPVYTLILNGFSGFYEEMACLYFTLPEARHASQVFYSELVAAAHVGDADAVERITRSAMLESMTLWRQANP
jgi:GntR family negative regulator for fad regulon and positive regulator of fabA